MINRSIRVSPDDAAFLGFTGEPIDWDEDDAPPHATASHPTTADSSIPPAEQHSSDNEEGEDIAVPPMELVIETHSLFGGKKLSTINTQDIVRFADASRKH